MLYVDDEDFIELKKMVSEMLATEDKGFNDWEINFLDDMKSKPRLTIGHADKIEQIYKAKM